MLITVGYIILFYYYVLVIYPKSLTHAHRKSMTALYWCAMYLFSFKKNCCR